MALVLLNGLCGALLVAGVPWRYPAPLATVRSTPSRHQYLIVAPIATHQPAFTRLQAAASSPQRPNAVWINLWVNDVPARTVFTLVDWTLPFRQLAIVPVGTSLVLCAVTTALQRRPGSARSSDTGGFDRHLSADECSQGHREGRNARIYRRTRLATQGGGVAPAGLDTVQPAPLGGTWPAPRSRC
jgi:hypothetical protein